MEVMQAYLDGKKIEAQSTDHPEHGWNLVKTPSWDWQHWDYRVKQEPREFSVVVGSDGIPLGVGTTTGVIPLGKNYPLKDAKVIRVREIL
jgi:hypothetical protein